MLKNVSSIYFIKFVFSYINEKRKLEIVKTNKDFQKIIDINIINYKLFAGKHLIYEENGKGKEYSLFNNRLIFEGEYLNGKKNGKGKEYSLYDNKLIFEGEYLNGKRHGEGKEYDFFGYSVFEGEYKNNKKWNGKGYHRNKLIYEIKDGKGIIKELNNDDHIKFEGEYMDGQLNGKYKEYFDDGSLLFEGECLNGKKWNGKGYDLKNNIVYEINNGKGYIKQYGMLNFKECLFFEGDFVNGEKNGYYKDYIAGKLSFECEYKNGKKNGKGKKYNYKTGGVIFEGEYLYDWKIKGKGFIEGKLEYEGEYFFEKKWNGKGYDKNGNIIYILKNGTGKVKEYNKYEFLVYDGEYLNGKKHGKAKEYDNGILIFEGEYLNGEKNGFVKEYDSLNGELEFEGEYLNGKKNGLGKEYNYGILIYEGEYLNDKKMEKGKNIIVKV